MATLQPTNTNINQLITGDISNATNTAINNLLQNFEFINTTGGTTTLTSSNQQNVVFTGTSTETLQLPNAGTLFTSYTFLIVNKLSLQYNLVNPVILLIFNEGIA